MDIDLNSLVNYFQSQEVLLMLGLILGLSLLSLVSPSRGKLTSGRMAGLFDKINAAVKGEKQLKKQVPNQICFYCGTPNYWQLGSFQVPVFLQMLLGATPTLYLPDSERSAIVIGAPGSGKTASILDPVVTSAIQQQKAILIWDKKGDQTFAHVPYAVKKGYHVNVFAPGKDYTCVINPLDFLRDETDATMAREVATVINSNSKTLGARQGDEFFTRAGEQVIQGILQLAKSVEAKYPDSADLVMAYAFIQLPNLVQRLDYAVNNNLLNPFVASSFSQLLSVKDAEKTISGILGNASGIFSGLMQLDLLPSFMGKSTVSPILGEKMMITFQLDEARRSVVGPLIASVMHMMIVKNAEVNRSSSLLVMLDEFPALVFQGIEKKINEHRSRGISYFLGAQSLDQIYNTYGERNGNAIIDAASTKVVFNTGGSISSAERFSKTFGEEEVKLKNKSRSYSRTGGTRSESESLQRKTLVTVDQINRLPSGTCFVVNPAYGSKKEGSFPFRQKVFISQMDWTQKSKMEKLWFDQVSTKLAQRENKHRGDTSEESILAIIQRRKSIAEEFLPLPSNQDDRSEPLPSSKSVTEPTQNHRKDSPKFNNPNPPF